MLGKNSLHLYHLFPQAIRQISKEWCCQYINRIVYVLNQHKYSDHKSCHQCKYLFRFTLQKQEADKHGRSMSRKEQILGDIVCVSISKITYRVLDRNQSCRRIQRHQRNSKIPKQQQENNRINHQQKLLRVLQRT